MKAVILAGGMGTRIAEESHLRPSDLTVDARTSEITYHTNYAEPWRVTLVDTGVGTMTGGRLRRVSRYLDPDESFCMTYGDGVADIDIGALIAFHRRRGKLATVAAVTPPGRYGALLLDDDRVIRFSEKPPGDNALINGGFFVLHPGVLDRIEGDDTPWETEPLESLARDGELYAYRHTGFWQPMDTLRDKTTLETLWSTGEAPWKMWKD